MSYIVILMSFQTIYSINYMVSMSRNSRKIADRCNTAEKRLRMRQPYL